MAARAPFFGVRAAALALTLAPTPAHAVSPEARVKAAYLYKLASFVRWPDGAARGQFRMCVAGSSEIAGVLQALVRGQRVAGLPVEIDEVGFGQATSVQGCNVLFMARGQDTARGLMNAAAGQPILTVADRDGGTRGGVIDFVVRDGKVRFMIDRGLARRQGLELSSKLLSIALAVEP
ncbi:MAG: YfiR family protein [Tsuneonella sp.]